MDQKTASVPSISFGRLEVVPGVLKGRLSMTFGFDSAADCLLHPTACRLQQAFFLLQDA